MKKNQTSMAVITTASMEQSGISTKLDQKDVVEVLAYDTYNAILRKIKDLNEEIVALKESLFQEQQHKIKFHKDLESILGVSIDINSISVCKDKISETYTNFALSLDQSHGENYACYRSTFNPYFYSKILFSYKTSTFTQPKSIGKNIEEGTEHVLKYSKSIKLKIGKREKAILMAIEDKNKEICDFHSKLPGQGSTKIISLAKLEKEIRVKVNKTIIKNQAPGVQKELEKLFNISL